MDNLFYIFLAMKGKGCLERRMNEVPISQLQGYQYAFWSFVSFIPVLEKCLLSRSTLFLCQT